MAWVWESVAFQCCYAGNKQTHKPVCRYKQIMRFPSSLTSWRAAVLCALAWRLFCPAYQEEICHSWELLCLPVPRWPKAASAAVRAGVLQKPHLGQGGDAFKGLHITVQTKLFIMWLELGQISAHHLNTPVGCALFQELGSLCVWRSWAVAKPWFLPKPPLR